MHDEIPPLNALREQAFRFRKEGRYAAHPIEATLRYHCAQAEKSGSQSHGGLDFESVEIHSIAPLEEGAKCAQIAKEWIDKGLAKCHEIAVLYPSSRNPPAWIGKIHGISFVDTSSRTEEASRVQTREPSATAAKPLSSFYLHTSSFSQARTFVLGATRAQQLLAVLQ